jgi:hypothetical protein
MWWAEAERLCAAMNADPDVTDDRMRELGRALNAIHDKMIETAARTPDGIRLQLQIALDCYDDDDSLPVRALRGAIASLERLAEQQDAALDDLHQCFDMIHSGLGEFQESLRSTIAMLDRLAGGRA